MKVLIYPRSRTPDKAPKCCSLTRRSSNKIWKVALSIGGIHRTRCSSWTSPITTTLFRFSTSRRMSKRGTTPKITWDPPKTSRLGRYQKMFLWWMRPVKMTNYLKDSIITQIKYRRETYKRTTLRKEGAPYRDQGGLKWIRDRLIFCSEIWASKAEAKIKQSNNLTLLAKTWTKLANLASWTTETQTCHLVSKTFKMGIR